METVVYEVVRNKWWWTVIMTNCVEEVFEKYNV